MPRGSMGFGIKTLVYDAFAYDDIGFSRCRVVIAGSHRPVECEVTGSVVVNDRSVICGCLFGIGYGVQRFVIDFDEC